MKTSKKIYGMYLALTACAAVLVSCSEENDAFLNIDPQQTIALPAAGGSTAVALETNVGDWTFRFEYGEWLTAKVVDNTIVIAAAPNDNLNSRGAMLEWAWCQYVGKQTCFDLAAFGGPET